MIYNEWFRDENLEAPLMLGYKKSDDGGSSPEPANDFANNAINKPEYTTNTKEGDIYAMKPAKAGKFHDYFTSCLPSPLKSDPVEISLTGNAPVKLYGDSKLEEVKPESYTVKLSTDGEIFNSVAIDGKNRQL